MLHLAWSQRNINGQGKIQYLSETTGLSKPDFVTKQLAGQLSNC